MVLTTLFNGARETRELTDGAWMIGRGASCRVRFDSPDVSERHAILTVRDGRAILEDLHSSNGTLVNGEPIDGAVVLDGGMVAQVGSAMLRVSESDVSPDSDGSLTDRPEDAEASARSGLAINE